MSVSSYPGPTAGTKSFPRSSKACARHEIGVTLVADPEAKEHAIEVRAAHTVKGCAPGPHLIRGVLCRDVVKPENGQASRAFSPNSGMAAVPLVDVAQVVQERLWRAATIRLHVERDEHSSEPRGLEHRRDEFISVCARIGIVALTCPIFAPPPRNHGAIHAGRLQLGELSLERFIVAGAEQSSLWPEGRVMLVRGAPIELWVPRVDVLVPMWEHFVIPVQPPAVRFRVAVPQVERRVTAEEGASARHEGSSEPLAIGGATAKAKKNTQSDAHMPAP
eukprot:CAMPEP_0117592280 /NCGR_PEP_ID=MMETSP0784-20121206/71993_1 /TAXON_ID=39447 /ORGANISM="" /LENGTH=276 /DNA_ID=CAMNT_0005394081 /DNA_START=259 /DNA_END=1087 /DNA_ORIENTATION=-